MLGFLYMGKVGYDIDEFDDVFQALERIGDREQGALPTWLSTHPAPVERVKAAQARAAAAGPQRNARIGHEDYLQRIDGLVYGKDPRQGFFKGPVFFHPRLRFQLTFPQGWQTENLTQAVVAVAPGNRAVLQLTIAGDISPEAALERFFSQRGVAAGRVARDSMRGQPAVLGEFQARTDGGIVQGLASYLRHGGLTYQLLGYSAAPQYGNYGAALEQAIRSFGPVSDPAIVNVQPQRIDVVKIEAPMTVTEFARRFSSAVPAQTLAILNGFPNAESTLPAGTLVKRVVA